MKQFISAFVIVALALSIAARAGVTKTASATPIAADSKDKYIVVFLNSVNDPQTTAEEMAAQHGLALGHVYGSALKGFSATIPLARLGEITGDPRVSFVTPDGIVSLVGRPPKVTPPQTLPTGVDRVDAELSSETGGGIGVAILDTGIDLSHPDLKSNIVAGKNCLSGGKANDDNGHGTHVAGTVAALNNSVGVVGVAPQAKLIAVKVLNAAGSGTWSGVICGIDWVTANAVRYNIRVANMSLGSTGVSDDNCGSLNNDPVHQAICRSRDAGITFVVAAGNDGIDAANFMPANYDDAVITVSALADTDGKAGGLGPFAINTADDTFATWSNYGRVVDLGAPGYDILSTYKGGAYASGSGTSMAAPHVAGAVALYLAKNPGSTWFQVRDALRSLGEALGSGHTDPSGVHPEPVINVNSL